MINHKAIGEYRYLNDRGGGGGGSGGSGGSGRSGAVVGVSDLEDGGSGGAADGAADGSVREAGVTWNDATEVRVIRSGSDIDYLDYKTDVITDCTVVDDGSGVGGVGGLSGDRKTNILYGWHGGKRVVCNDGERAVAGKCGTMVAMFSLAVIGVILLIIIIKIYNAGEK